MTTDKFKIKVRNRVNKEYRDFQNECLEKGALYTFNNALKVAFYKEMRIFVLNGIVSDSMFMKMDIMENILAALWDIYSRNVVKSSGDHFLEQLIDFHNNNIERVKANLGGNL